MNFPPSHETMDNLLARRMLRLLLYSVLVVTSLAIVFDATGGTFLKFIFYFAIAAGLPAVYLMDGMSRRLLEVSYSRVHVLYVVYLIVCTASLILAFRVSPGIAQLEIILFGLFVLFFSEHANESRRTVLLILILTAVVCVIALIYLIVPESSSIYTLCRQLSTMSTFGNASYFAGFLAAVFPLAVIQIRLDHNRHPLRQTLMIALSIVILLLLIRTESRSAWLALGATALFMAMVFFRSTKGRLIIIGLMIVAAAITWFLFSTLIERRISGLLEIGPQSSLIRRLYFYEGAWKAFLSSPLLGNGIGNFLVFLPKFRSPDYWMYRSEDVVSHAHNEFLEILSETGLIGLGVFCLILGTYWRAWFKTFRTLDDRNRWMQIGFGASLGAVLIDNLFSMNLRTMPVFVIFWMVMGVSLSMMSIKRKTFVLRIPDFVRKFRFVPIFAWIGYLVWCLSSIPSKYEAQRDFLEGSLLRARGETAASTLKLSHALQNDTSIPEAYIYLASNLIDDGNYHEAQRNIEHLLGEYPYYPKARTLMAICFFELGDTAKAYKTIGEELAIEGSPQTLCYAATFSRSMGKREEEYAYILTLLQKNIASGMDDFAPEGVQRLAELCASVPYRGDCIWMMKQLGRKFSSDVPVLLTIAEAYMTFNLPTEAESTLSVVRLLPVQDQELSKRVQALSDWIVYQRTQPP